MKFAIGILAALLITTAALGQNRGVSAYYGPFTDAEAQLLSAVWPEIRVAANYQDINWPAHGLSRPPGNRNAQRLMAENWREIRNASRFEQINWDALAAGPAQQTRRYEHQYPGQQGRGPIGPFDSEDAAVMSRIWSQIRVAARYEDINWRAHGVAHAPGDRTAQEIMSRYWGELREADRLEDINWEATTGWSPNRRY